jgi:hypothetical protein
MSNKNDLVTITLSKSELTYMLLLVQFGIKTTVGDPSAILERVLILTMPKENRERLRARFNALVEAVKGAHEEVVS